MRSIKGFTLIEVILASVLVAVVSLAIYHSYSQGILVWKKGQEASNQDKAIMFIERITREIKNSRPFAPIGFSVEEEKISFPNVVLKYGWDKTVSDDKESEAEQSDCPLPLIARFTYEYDKTNEKITRMEEIYAYPNLDELKRESDAMKKSTPRTILEDVEKITFSCATAKTEDLDFTNPISTTIAPYAIKIELKLKTMKKSLSRTVFIPVSRAKYDKQK
ncbi:MAG: prepilin-type N-terminal cleavage/methylation domain-containing protein [Planctomycetota bacterium]|nr:prepilin-type N-terminal cleavage/methylation domain-containing protein [Planctomycetota bacterium]MDI6787187.1 prepilin-type N-terminal cleavage/methylation domain-containing protein [Planctomycetota bacterium]